MKRLIMFAALALLLAGCANETAEPVKKEPIVASETDEKAVTKEEPSGETVPVTFNKNEVDELMTLLGQTSDETIQLLNDAQAAVYVCGTLCVDQPLSDVQLNLDMIRPDLQRVSDDLSNLAPQIEKFVTSDTRGLDREGLTPVAEQFNRTSASIDALLVKEDWMSWEEPGIFIQTLLDEFAETYWYLNPGMKFDSEEQVEDFEAETNTVSGISQVLMNRDLILEELNEVAVKVREEPFVESDGTYGYSSPDGIELQALRDSLMSGTELALSYPQSDAITTELQSARDAMGQWDTAVHRYNELLYTYGESVDADDMMAKWEELNAALDAVYATLDFPTAALEAF